MPCDSPTTASSLGTASRSNSSGPGWFTLTDPDGNPILIELPSTVELTVKDCPPEVKGATVTNQTKDATMETGLKVRVPAFIKQGEAGTVARQRLRHRVQNGL